MKTRQWILLTIFVLGLSYGVGKVYAQIDLQDQIISLADDKTRWFIEQTKTTVTEHNAYIVQGLTDAVQGHDWPSTANRDAFIAALEVDLGVPAVNGPQLSVKFYDRFRTNLGIADLTPNDPNNETYLRIKEVLTDNFTNGNALWTYLKDNAVPKE